MVDYRPPAWLPLRTMGLTFNDLLAANGIDPKSVRLIRHRAGGVISPYELWRTDPAAFETFQSRQKPNPDLGTDGFWATFVAPSQKQTLFVGLYKASCIGKTRSVYADPVDGQSYPAGALDEFALVRDPTLDEFAGRLLVEWGDGYRSWIQRADRQTKAIAEIRATRLDPPFPGVDVFSTDIESIESLPAS